MQSQLTRGTRRLIRGTQNMVSQIVVSVVAAVCVAFITNAYLGESRDAASVASTPAIEAAAPGASLDAALPALPIEVVADAPKVVTPGEEVFPGVPAGVSPAALQQAVEKKRERRRFLGIPLPFTTTADSGGSASDEIEALAQGG
jgi:type IV secretory pathway VirB10-like protein